MTDLVQQNNGMKELYHFFPFDTFAVQSFVRAVCDQLTMLYVAQVLCPQKSSPEQSKT